MKSKICKEMKKLFKTAENAYLEMDFEGQGYIEQEDFFNTFLSYKLPYTKDEVLALFKHEKWFSFGTNSKMDYETFK